MTRWKASAIHLTLSVIVLCTVAAVLVWRWYPPGLFHMAHADKLLLIIAGVDVVMGPLLTLIVFKQGKKTLKFDLTVIALLQVAAMTYGLSTVWQSRPVYMVALADRFRLVFANELDPADLAQGAPQYRSLPWLTVETIGALVPKDPKERSDLLFMTLDTGKDLPRLPKYYAPFPAAASGLLSHAVAVQDFMGHLSAEDRRKLASAVGASGRTAGGLRVVPISSSRGEATMLIDADTGTPSKPVEIDPWLVLSEIQRADSHAHGTNTGS
jgi:hypothetical protein